jgi:hypothetical protein
MTTIDHRTPAVLENVSFVETTRPIVLPPQPKPVTNPYGFHMRAGFVLTCGSGLGLVWAVGHDNPFAPLLMAVTLLLAAVTVGLTRAYNGWFEPLDITMIHDQHA